MSNEYSLHIAVDVIIPAYNEAATIDRVVSAACAAQGIRRVLVVCDGCADNTAQVAREAGADVLELQQNGGKAAAMYAGVAATTAPFVLFLDADLLGLTAQHVEHLIAPLQAGTHATVGVFMEGRLATDLAQQISPHLSGQRVVPRWLMETLMREMDAQDVRFGIETVITRLLKWHRIPTVRVMLPNVTQRTKEEKLGIRKGVRSRLRMYWEIAAVTLLLLQIRHVFPVMRWR